MGRIILLDENSINKIAAGEVIERPSSIVKELVENSIDAGATQITVEIKNGGINLIAVSDNGCGIDPDDVEMSFERHATGKIRNAKDIEKISTMGFRGEALASIAAVSETEMVSRVPSNDFGMQVVINGGNTISVSQNGCPDGTSIKVKNLFFNTPARYKFLKKDSTEAGYISDIALRLALANSNIAFKYLNNGSVSLQTPGNGDLKSTIYSIYGKEISQNIIEVNFADEMFSVKGYIGNYILSRTGRAWQSIFVNRRYVKNKVVTAAIDEAYRTLLMKNKYAFVVLMIDVNPTLVDVNVHPSKTEVKFSNEGDLFRAVLHALNEALSSNIKIPTFSDTNNNKDTDQMAMSDIVIEAKESIPNPVPIKEWDTDTVNNLKISASLPINEEMQLYTVEKSEQNDSSLAEVLVEGEIIGQVFDTYIIIQYDEQLFFIDQHAAHERIRYAYLSEKNRTDSVPAQTLLNPSVIELLPREKSLLIDNSDFIAKMGFDFDDFGNNAVLVRQVPAIDHIDDIKELLMGIVDSIEQLESFNDAASDEFLYSVACKAAIKANQKLTIQEMKALLNEFAGLKKAFTCPHGRPVILSIEKKKIEKEFKRVL